MTDIIYIHFTDLEGAKEIAHSKELWASSYVDGVFAAVKGGTYSKNVQLSKLGRAKNRDVAVYFKTSVLPNYCYPEECVWKAEKIPVKVLQIKLTKSAIHDLDGSIPILNKDSIDERLDIPTKENSIKEALWALVRESIDEAIPEPKRPNAPTTLDLKISPNGGYENIMKVLRAATPAEIDYWGRWYHNAKADVQELATKYNVPFGVMAAVVAVLSPGNKWHLNLMAAERVLQKAPKINAYTNNIIKARKILETGETKWVTGPKVSVFLRSLIDPDIVKDDLVLDGHAINIWRGRKIPLNSMAMPNKKERQQMLDDYKRAAKDFGTSVQAVQAITWYIWKYTVDPPPPLQMKFNLLPQRKKAIRKEREQQLTEGMDEAAVSIESLDPNNIALSIISHNQTYRRYILFNKDAFEAYVNDFEKTGNSSEELGNKAILAMMSVADLDYRGAAFDEYSPYVASVVAQKGYGPLIYEIVMSDVRKLASDPTGDTSPSAKRVWQKFFQREDVIKRLRVDRPKNSTDPLDYEYSLTKKVPYQKLIWDNPDRQHIFLLTELSRDVFGRRYHS